MTVFPKTHPPREVYQLLTACVVPRPIGWITSVSKENVVNAAPFSFFNAVCGDPPMIMVAIERRNGIQKDSSRNIEQSKEFVVNVVTYALADAMNRTSASFPPSTSEVEKAGLTLMPSEVISTPRIEASPVHLECRLVQHIELGKGPTDLIIGEIVAFHVNDSIMENGRIDPKHMKAIGRLSGSWYCTTDGLFQMERPQGAV